MTKDKIIEHLESLADYTSDTMEIDTCYPDIWAEDTEALGSAILAVRMLYDIFDNLAGQDLKGEMIAILSKMGYEPQDFKELNICTLKEVAECIESYDN